MEYDFWCEQTVPGGVGVVFFKFTQNTFFNKSKFIKIYSAVIDSEAVVRN